MIPAICIFVYLALVLWIGIFAFRRSTGSGEDFFLANRSLGPCVFLLSLFGTNMTAFAILGSSGMSYQRGIGVFGLMASSSAIIIPLTIIFIGTRLWSLGKRFGHMTQVQYFRDRWSSPALGTLIFALTATMLVPYIIIGVMGGGEVMESLTTITGPDGKPILFDVLVDGKTVQEQHHWISYEFGGALVALVVMSYVFFGGMRGTAWVNAFQVVLFLSFGGVAVVLISNALGGFDQMMAQITSSKSLGSLLSRERISQQEFFSYMFIPLSAIMFPHMAIMCMTAEKVGHFRKTVVFYPLCIAAIWLPCVYLGVVSTQVFPGLAAGDSNDVIPRLLTEYTNLWVAGILGAGVMACVMASDSQIMALSTMFTQDIYKHYGGRERFGERSEVWVGRAFIIGICVISYLIAIALHKQEGIFELAIRFAFSGYAALAPIMLAAMFWRRSTAAGAWAAVVWVAVAMIACWWLHDFSSEMAKTLKPGATAQIFPALGDLFLRSKGGVTVYGYLPVMPMVLISAALVVIVSWCTRPPAQAVIAKYFPAKNDGSTTP